MFSILFSVSWSFVKIPVDASHELTLTGVQTKDLANLPPPLLQRRAVWQHQLQKLFFGEGLLGFTERAQILYQGLMLTGTSYFCYITVQPPGARKDEKQHVDTYWCLMIVDFEQCHSHTEVQCFIKTKLIHLSDKALT